MHGVSWVELLQVQLNKIYQLSRNLTHSALMRPTVSRANLPMVLMIYLQMDFMNHFLKLKALSENQAKGEDLRFMQKKICGSDKIENYDLT